MTTLLGTSDLVLSHWRPIFQNRSSNGPSGMLCETLPRLGGRKRHSSKVTKISSDVEGGPSPPSLDHSEQVARALLGRFSPGEHVAVWAANSPERALIEFGAALAGVTLVTVNPAYLDKELTFVLIQSERSIRTTDLQAARSTFDC